MTDSGANSPPEPLPTEVRLGRCPECRYILNGLPARGNCPECGWAYDEQTHVWHCRTHVLFMLMSRSTIVLLFLVWLIAVGNDRPILSSFLFGALALDIAFHAYNYHLRRSRVDTRYPIRTVIARTDTVEIIRRYTIRQRRCSYLWAEIAHAELCWSLLIPRVYIRLADDNSTVIRVRPKNGRDGDRMARVVQERGCEKRRGAEKGTHTSCE
ncbi:MAG: hypothetical protein D8M59_05120 [Planctomycetes bacterium]|nr:hypothetical protein [Planctomycetota bacterium]